VGVHVGYPLLQDVNFGWLYKMRTYAKARVMSHGTKDAVKVYVSDEGTADYVNLDALVFDAIGNLIHERYRTATDLVVIVGSDLVQEKYFKIVSAAGDKATEQVARDIIMSSRQLGGKPTMQVPFFPADAILITSLKNLSYYWQINVPLPSRYQRGALIDSDPVMKVLQVAAYRELLLRRAVQDAALQNFVAYATGTALDHLAALVAVARLVVTPADPVTGATAVMETDDALRQRIVLAPEGFSVAGPELAYVKHAKDARGDILDPQGADTSPAGAARR
jgi:hypothetical protein